MSRLRNYLDSIHPKFVKGGSLEKYYAIYEMVDTFLYTPKDVTAGTTHCKGCD
jgi:Na+-transporting NADH:ubiquinone oxidoreductase, subunit NqrB